VLGPIANNSRARATKRQRVSVEDDSDDEFGLDAATQQAMIEDGKADSFARANMGPGCTTADLYDRL
jgi:DNA mismatch repair protein MSH6